MNSWLEGVQLEGIVSVTHTCRLYIGTLGIQSPLDVQPLINNLDIATLMDPQNTFYINTQYWLYSMIPVYYSYR